jgi:restriction endonuclease Mrr
MFRFTLWLISFSCFIGYPSEYVSGHLHTALPESGDAGIDKIINSEPSH